VAVGIANDSAGLDAGEDDAVPGAAVPVLQDPVPRHAGRALARWGLLGNSAAPVFTPAPGIRSGLLLGLPALEDTGLLAAAREVLRSAARPALRVVRRRAAGGLDGQFRALDFSGVSER
jgi:hypothetical protein